MSGNTTVFNPVIYADFPDPCVINVDEIFYMTTTSMYFMPGIPVMRSYDLAHWEIISYVYPTFLDNPSHNLEESKNIYGKGSWATSLRFHNGCFYVCFNSNDAQSTFMYRTRDIENGPWEHSVIVGSHHDPSLLFDDDGRIYLVYGNGTIHILELTEDAMDVKPDGIHQILVDTPKVEGLNCEGSHFYKIGGRYYLMLIQWPRTGTKRRIQWCYQSNTLLGLYCGKVIFDDDMGYHNNGVAQGGMFQAGGSWYAMLFQDRSALGRCPVLLPVRWQESWPVLGDERKTPLSLEVPFMEYPALPFTDSDEFDTSESQLSHIWQWNHNPDNQFWSLVERRGYLRLTNGYIADCLVKARNTLVQRTVGPTCSFWTKLDVRGMKPGDNAGIAALQSHFGYIGIHAEETEKHIVMCTGEAENESQIFRFALTQEEVHLKVDFDFTDGVDTADFSYSYDGEEWISVGEPLRMVYRLDHFTGYHAALFSYATKETGGYADFDYMRFEKSNIKKGVDIQ